MRVTVVLLALVGAAGTAPGAQGPTTLQTCFYRHGGALPDARCTPGRLNRAVTQATIGRTVCRPGWSASVRPPTSWTEPRKFASMRAYGVSTLPGQAVFYEYDHLVPIELGGAPMDERNLWPEPRVVAGGDGARAKDRVENRLHRDVCAVPPRATLAEARRLVRRDWRKAR